MTGRGRSLLEAVCETFAPGAAAASAEAVLVELESLGRADRLRVRLALAVLASRAATALAGGGLRPFGALPAPERERVLLDWAGSRLAARRALFHGLRRLALGAAYADPAAARERWTAIGYPGPPGRVAAAPRRLRAWSGEQSCDVVVVGSGAGGGPAAAVLAQAGLDVIVVEAGGHRDAPDFDGGEQSAQRLLYRSYSSADLGIGLAAGWCVGGGTLVNYASSFRTPDPVREEWTAAGATLYGEPGYTAALDEVCERLGVTTAESRPSPRDLVLRRGLDALGWHAAAMPRSVRGCEQGGRCGFCGFGCPFRAKQSTLHVWLADADAAGARVLAETFVERIETRGGAAAGVVAAGPGGADLRIGARAVVCAAGALETPALLRRSGLGGPNVGRHLRLHPCTFVFGLFDEPVEPWGGTTQAVYSAEFGDLDGRGHGVRFATVPLHPGFVARMAPWTSARRHAETMRLLAHLACVVVQIRDRDGGEVAVARSGRPVVRYALSGRDAGHMRAGVAGAARILEAAGARELFTAHAGECRATTAAGLVERADAAGYAPGRCAYGSVHLMGSVRMGDACDPLGRVAGARGLVVCDGSVLPSAPGVNPMVTIEATARVAARALASDLG